MRCVLDSHAAQLCNVLLAKAQNKVDLPAPYDFATIGQLTASKFEALPDQMKERIR